MEQTRGEVKFIRRYLKLEYKNLVDSIASILFRYDPAEINFGDNTDEYEPEARTILPRLRTCQSVEDVQVVVHEEFQQWFDLEIASSVENYEEIAREIWCIWQDSHLGRLDNPSASQQFHRSGSGKVDS